MFVPRDVKNILVYPDTTLREAIKLLNEAGWQIVVVVDKEKRLVGTVTDGDIRRAILKGISLDVSVKDVMNKKPKSLKQNGYTKDELMHIFNKYSIKHLPIVDDANRVVGLILLEDVFKIEELYSPLPYFVVIMAGGKGTRLDPFTKILPKPLIPIGDKTMLEIIMEKWASFGFSRFILTLNYKKEVIKLYLKDLELPYDIYFVEEDKPLGTAGSLKLIEKEFDLTDPFLVTNCDVWVDVNLRSFVKFHREIKADVSIIGNLMTFKIPYGVIENNDSDLINIKEKPQMDFVINTGIYALNPKVIDLIKDDEAIDMPDLILRAKERGFKAKIYPAHGQYFDIGQWEVYKDSLKKLGAL